MLKRLFGQGQRRFLSGAVLKLRNGLAVMTALYVIVSSLLYLEPLSSMSVGFGLFFSLIFLTYTSPGSPTKHKVPLSDFLLSLCSLSISVYVNLQLERYITRQVFVDSISAFDIAFAVLSLVLLVEGTRRIIGPWLPGLMVLSLIYFSYGEMIPGRFGHMGFSLDYMVDGIFMSTYGIWGSPLYAATGKIMVFLIFGAFFVKSNAGQFLFDFAASLTGSSKGGIAKVAVVSSALFGMISGGPLSNVATTGSLTIPAMKKRGYSSVFAAATECCASVGGTFMPPIMGSVVFIMSEVIGMPYAFIAKRAFLPAVIYFSALYFTIDLRSRRLNIEGFAPEDRQPIVPLMLKGYDFFIPLIYLIYRLMSGMSTTRVGLESTAVIILLGLIRKHPVFKPAIIAEALQTSVHRGMMIVSAMASCGVLVAVINITGISSKFSSFLMSMVDYSVFLTLVLVMLITVFLGFVMNTTSAYLITAVICAPILIRFGFEALSVHLFILFYAAMATITPPVALTAFAAAAIADTSPLKVALQAMRIGISAYLLPFVFVYRPEILLYGTWTQTLMIFSSATFGVWLIAAGLENWWFGHQLNVFTRSSLLLSGILAITGNIYLIGAAIILSGLIYLLTQHLLEGSYEKI